MPIILRLMDFSIAVPFLSFWYSHDVSFVGFLKPIRIGRTTMRRRQSRLAFTRLHISSPSVEKQNQQDQGNKRTTMRRLISGACFLSTGTLVLRWYLEVCGTTGLDIVDSTEWTGLSLFQYNLTVKKQQFSSINGNPSLNKYKQMQHILIFFMFCYDFNMYFLSVWFKPPNP